MEPKLVTAFGVYAPDGYLLHVTKTREEGEKMLSFHGYTNVEDVKEKEFYGVEIKTFEGPLTAVYRSEELARLRLAPVGCF